MPRNLSITQARSRLPGLANALSRTSSAGAVAVTERGKPVLALLPWDLSEPLVETLEILGDQTLMGALRKRIKEARAGRTIPSASPNASFAWDGSSKPARGSMPARQTARESL